LAVEAEHHALSAKAAGLSGRLHSLLRSAQLLAIPSVPRVSERPQQLMGMGLQDHRPGTNSLPTFASGVAGGAEGT
jgi:hypothetical protein